MPSGIPARQIWSIVMAVLALVGVLLMKRQCASAVGNLFQTIGPAVVDGGHD